MGVRRSRAATCRARRETTRRPTPRETQLRARCTRAPTSRARTCRRTRRSVRSNSARPSPTGRSFVVLPVVWLFVDTAGGLFLRRLRALDELSQLDRILHARRLIDTGRDVDSPPTDAA